MKYKFILLVTLFILRVDANGEKSLFVDVYPGFGWDDLRFLDMSPIFDVSNFNSSSKFQSCIEVIPIYETKADLDSTVIDMFDAHTSDFSSNLFISGGIGKFWQAQVKGSYSQEYQRSKKQQGEEKTIALRNQIEYIMHDVMLTSACQLHPLAKKALIQISNYQASNETTMAKYAAQLFVKKYGTHYTSRLILGGSIVHEDYIQKSTYYENDSQSRTYRAAALASFRLAFDVSAGFEWTTNDSNVINTTKEFTHKIVRVLGGKLNLTRGSTESWQSTIDSKPAIIRRAIENMTYFIQSDKIPELSEFELKLVRDEVNAAIDMYIEMNSYRGCMNQSSPSFNWVANDDDDSCEPAKENSQFGGFFRNCSEDSRLNPKCDQYKFTNYYTNLGACPSNFEGYLLRQTIQTEKIIKHQCTSCGFLWLQQCCDDIDMGVGNRTISFYGCNSRTNQIKASNQSLKVSNDYVYGGSFTSTKTNPVTGIQMCSSGGFQTVNIMDDLRTCLAQRIEDTKGLPHYGGMYSCDQNNIAFDNIGKDCPTGYSSYLMNTIDENCLLYVCLKFDQFPDIRQLPSIILPPFFSVSLKDLNRTRIIDSINFDKRNTLIPSLSTQKSNNLTFGLALSSLCIVVLFTIPIIYLLIQSWRLNHHQPQQEYTPIE